MCAQTALVEEYYESRQADFRGTVISENGGGMRLLSGEEQLSSGARSEIGTALIGAVEGEVGDQQTASPVVLEGALVVSASTGEFKVPMMARVERTAGGGAIVSFYDHAETLLLSTDFDTNTLNINTRYAEKSLTAALTSARFLEALATTPRVLSFEVYAPVEEAGPALHRVEVADLPLSIPEAWLDDHRNRVGLLEGLLDIWTNTGVEVRYPANTDDKEGLRNYNFVQMAVRGGWVVLSVSSLDIHVPEVQARALLEELQSGNQIGRAFYLEVPKESYLVFGIEVDLGPSSRYLAAARLATTREEIEEQLSVTGDNAGRVSLTWVPIGGVPVHVFFDQWSRSSAIAVRQGLREYEAIYGVRSQHFKQA